MSVRLSADALANAAEQVVVVLAQSNDQAAFEELVRRKHTSIRQLLRRLSRDPALADDLAQNVFLVAWRRLASLRAPGAFGSWLRQIAVNEWLMHLRSRDPEGYESESVEPAETMNHAAVIDLDAALSKLAAMERLCVVLAYQEGMSHSEIVRATRLPLGTVKSHVLRGGARLRRYLEAYDRRRDCGSR